MNIRASVRINEGGMLALKLAVAGCLLAMAGLGLGQAADKPLEGDRLPTSSGDLVIHPINHATFALAWNGKAVYVDPVGGAKRFQGLPAPDLVLITDIHGDHLDPATLSAIVKPSTVLIAPRAVYDKLPAALKQQTTLLANGDAKSVLGLQIEALPMYNTTADRLRFHEKGRGNGYLVTFGGKRVYISGDTEDIPEMRALRNIDVAFLCMNLPYTMTVEQAANAVRAFNPKIVYPYHDRGSDVQKFKELVGANDGIEVRLRDWYK